MSNPANDDFSQHLSDGEESIHEDASATGAEPKQQQQMIPQTTAISNIEIDSLSAKPQRATSNVFKSSNIFKDVEDYLKTYSSGGMNISLLNRVARDSIGSTGFSEKIVSFYVFGIIQVIARLYLKDDDAVNAEAFINKVLFFVNTTVTTRAGQKNSENLLVFQVRVSKTLKGSTQTLKSVSSFGEDKVYLWSVYGQKKVQRL
ncbi:hypothetical protein Tco_0472945 [Tanacetum coccineum]